MQAFSAEMSIFFATEGTEDTEFFLTGFTGKGKEGQPRISQIFTDLFFGHRGRFAGVAGQHPVGQNCLCPFEANFFGLNLF